MTRIISINEKGKRKRRDLRPGFIWDKNRKQLLLACKWWRHGCTYGCVCLRTESKPCKTSGSLRFQTWLLIYLEKHLTESLLATQRVTGPIRVLWLEWGGTYRGLSVTNRKLLLACQQFIFHILFRESILSGDWIYIFLYLVMFPSCRNVSDPAHSRIVEILGFDRGRFISKGSKLNRFRKVRVWPDLSASFREKEAGATAGVWLWLKQLLACK